MRKPSPSPAAKAFKKVKKQSVSTLKKKADKAVSLYVRQAAADRQGYATCYTCGARKRWQELQCGHFVPRNVSRTRYDLDNLRVQDVGCNVWGRGRLHIFSGRLLAEIGGRRFKALLARARETHQFTVPELQVVERGYRERLAELLNQ